MQQPRTCLRREQGAPAHSILCQHLATGATARLVERKTGKMGGEGIDCRPRSSSPSFPFHFQLPPSVCCRSKSLFCWFRGIFGLGAMTTFLRDHGRVRVSVKSHASI